MSGIIEPRVLKGFRDSLPDEEIRRKEMIDTIEKTFRSFGFVPIDTPVLEYSEILLGKGSGETDKQIYRFQDAGKRDIAMRFDLTIPFARFMAAHINELYLPFKRFHIAKVWRGENTQRGRYREFMQCDFDSVGSDSVSSDLEILLLLHSSLTAVGINDFTIAIAHRGLFNSYLEKLGIQKQSEEILRTVDKLGKLGEEKISGLLQEFISPEHCKNILDYIGMKSSSAETLLHLSGLLEDPDNPHLLRLKDLFSALEECGVANSYVVNPSITRGLDYYTGLVFETFLNSNPGVGSVASGGRYNNLAAVYSKKEIAGVGGSIGIDRLIAGIEEMQQNQSPPAQTDLLVFNLDDTYLSYYHSLAMKLRERGIRCEVFPEPKKMKNQFAFCERKNIPFAVICGEDEINAGVLTAKNLATRENMNNITLDTLVGIITDES